MVATGSAPSGSAQTAGATAAGFMEIAIFHPFDTCAKRLMSYQHRVVELTAPRRTARNVEAVVFGRLPQPRSAARRVVHLYPGSSWAVVYKVSQRVIKFAGQPMVRDRYASSDAAARVAGAVGPKAGKVLVEIVAGVTVGLCELSLLPIDRMKVLAQTNAAEVANRGLRAILRDEGVGSMYAGAATTGVRNIVGSTMLFGGTAAAKEAIFGLEDYRSATLFQNTVCSTCGACLGVFWTSPADVIKTRIQNKSFAEGPGVSGIGLLCDVIRTEGLSAFYKGITPKIITSAPKLVFCYTVTELIANAIRHRQQ